MLIRGMRNWVCMLRMNSEAAVRMLYGERQLEPRRTSLLVDG